VNRRRLGLAAALAAVLAAACAFLRPPDVVRLDTGGVTGGFLGPGWSVSDRTDLNRDAGALDPSSAGFSRFRFRAASPSAEIDLPVGGRGGAVRLTLRAMARVRTAVSFHVSGDAAGEIVIPRGPWARHEITLPTDAAGLRATLALRPLPMVRVPDEFMQQPVVWIAEIAADAPGSALEFSPAARALLAAVPLALFAFALAVGAGPAAALAAAAASVAVLALLVRAAPLPLMAALTRLLPLALGAGLLTRLVLARWSDTARGTRAALSALVTAGVLFHGALPFVPGFDPYDVEVHVRRSQDLGRVPLEYGALLRYGSHLPTETQTFGTATAALGEKTLIPYSPLPYVAFYALERLGIDLHWGMIALDAVLAMAVVPWLWIVAARVWSATSAWIAALLYTLDLPVWHHLGRAHVPASFGSALGTAALLYLAWNAERVDTRRRVAAAAAVLAVAVLGYSSLIVFFGLFGLALLAFLAADARAIPPPSRRGLALALAFGGLLAGFVFYFHYLPGLLRGGSGLQQEADLFLPRTYFIFHNESRQSMRVWAAGFAIPLLAGLLSAPVALRRARPAARTIFTCWLVTWGLVMIAKEPFGFPRPLRWGKEDQFVSPLLALLIGGAVGALPRAWMRWSAAVVAVAVAVWLQAGDFAAHASGLLP
jgi:hypothetical protein